MPKSGFGGCGRGQEIAECPRIDRLAFLVAGIGYGVMDGGKVRKGVVTNDGPPL
jgi:hypothetical protein